MGKGHIGAPGKWYRIEWDIEVDSEIRKYLIAILILLTLLSITKVACTQENYPEVLLETTTIEVENDTLWVLTHNQYVNCLANTDNLIASYKIIDKMKLNEIDYQTQIKFLSDDIKLLEDSYLDLQHSFEIEERNKRLWRGFTFSGIGIVVMQTIIILVQ